MNIPADTKIYKVSEIENVANLAGGLDNLVKKQGISYYNIPCSFDIEVSSFYKSRQRDKSKTAIMYEWSFCLCGYVIIGRTWEEFDILYKKLIEIYSLSKEKHLVIYVHNLGYEFQFIRKRFEWKKVFSLDKRRPIQAITMGGVEFRCSYLLSGYGLAKLSDQLIKYRIKKMVGDLDYNLIRNSKTPLTDKELQYCINDVLVVVAYIQETIERLGKITRIPLTKTGYVREYTRNACLYEKGGHSRNTDKFKKYRKFITGLTLDVESYKQCKRAFAGGFTHASPLYSIHSYITNVDSFDETSAYPAVMCSERFPMSIPERITIKSVEEFNFNIKHYCCIFDVKFTNIESKYNFENYISASKCRLLKNAVENNGRVYSADSLIITITEQDYAIINKMYYFDNMEVFNFTRYFKGYLPKPIIESILSLYKSKTELKDVDGKESEYMRSKEDVNSEYGMMVTDICRDNIVYDDEWSEEECDMEHEIEKYNSSIKRVLYYPWGIYVTAYARRNLFTAILECAEDYIYSDTDSVKIINSHNHLQYFENYNKNIIKKCELVMDYYNLPRELIRPKNKYGVEKPLGVWEWEKKSDESHSYRRFKTLGAKRYLVETESGKVSLTVSGLNKKTAIPYMLDKYGMGGIFDAFNDNLVIPADYSGRTTHTYIDEERKGVVVDYLGNKAKYHELSCVHMENSEYSLSISEKYLELLFNLGIVEMRD